MALVNMAIICINPGKRVFCYLMSRMAIGIPTKRLKILKIPMMIRSISVRLLQSIIKYYKHYCRNKIGRFQQEFCMNNMRKNSKLNQRKEQVRQKSDQVLQCKSSNQFVVDKENASSKMHHKQFCLTWNYFTEIPQKTTGQFHKYKKQPVKKDHHWRVYQLSKKKRKQELQEREVYKTRASKFLNIVFATPYVNSPKLRMI